MLYLVPLPPSRLDKRHKATGWRHIGLDGEGRKMLAEMVKQIEGRGIAEVWASDLDEDAARVVAEQLHVPLCKEFQLRRFNWGRHHAAPLSKAEDIVSGLIKKWETNPTIPIRSGDSWMSFEKRQKRMYEKLTTLDCAALVTDEQTMRYWRDLTPNALVRNGNPIHQGKIYTIRRLED
jgi:broad specificity phosphatase PhoE